jgi:hypothetical protein
MRKTAFTIVTLLIAGSATQLATASEHHGRAGRDNHHWDYRGSYNQLGNVAPRARESSAPAANETKSCDVIWCYPD